MSKFIPPEIQTKFRGIELYDYQKDAVEKCINHMRTSNEPAYVNASVSAGKSLMIAAICKHFQNVKESAESQGFQSHHKILILVRVGDLVANDHEACWDIGAKNSIFSAGMGIKSTHYDTITGSERTVFNSLNNQLKDIKFTAILWDECHQCSYDNKESQALGIVNELKCRNPNLKIIGFTGSPYRGKDPIIGDFWKKELVTLDREYLTKRGFVMPVTHGLGDKTINYSGIVDDYNPDTEGNVDFNRSQLKEMEVKILKDRTRTQAIMNDVQKVMQNRNLALVLCAGSKHMKEASKYLDEGTYALITEKTPTKERLAIKERCEKGELKFVFIVNTWTTGVSINRMDTLVILRLIGSIVVFEQSTGRIVRRLNQKEIKEGVIKNEGVILDYTDTSSVMSTLMNSDELDQAEKQRAKQNNESMVICPKCGEENSSHARRCCHVDEKGNRCDYFFSYKTCEDMFDLQTGKLIKKGCGTKNDPASKVCRKCGGYMINPNEKLNGEHYSKDDFINVIDFDFGLTRDGNKVLVQYKLENGKKARELFDIHEHKRWVRAKWNSFVKLHVTDKALARKMTSCFDPKKAMNFKEAVNAPIAITHRVNDRGFDLIAKKVF